MPGSVVGAGNGLLSRSSQAGGLDRMSAGSISVR